MSTTSSWTAGPPLSRRHFAHKKPTPIGGADAVVEPRPMAWSWRLGRFLGIDVYIHGTFLLLIGWLMFRHAQEGSSAAETFLGFAFITALFTCVLLHEYGHALAARRFGVGTRDITLLPIGGVARLERIPREPWQELVVAVAGPAVNVVIAALLYGALRIFDPSFPMTPATIFHPEAPPLAQLMAVNLLLVAFNMLPAFPMDGGRVLRSVLAMKVSRVKATRIASVLGQVMALLFLFVGLTSNPMMLLIALFVYMGASQEYQATKLEAAVEGLTVRDGMLTQFRTLSTNDPLSRAVALLLEGSQHDFPVLDENFRVAGMLLRQDLIAALSKDGGSNQPAINAMREVTAVADPTEPLIDVFERMQTAQLTVIPVFSQDSKLAGLLTMENIAEVVMVRNALEKSREISQLSQA